MYLASDARNIRYNGTGRGYAGTVAGSSLVDLGELESINYAQAVTTEKMKSTRNAARAVILEVETEREASITIGLREMTEQNLKMALLGGDFQAQNQSASYQDLTETAYTADEYVDLGKLNVSILRLTYSNLAGGTFSIGDSVTGAPSGATGKVAWVDGTAKILDLVNVSGTFTAADAISVGGVSADVDAVETLEDVVVLNAANTVRYVQGTDYTLDPDYGYLRVLSTGSIAASPDVAFNYPAVTKKYMWAFSAGSIQKKFVFVTDKDDRGTRFRITFHKVQLNLNGDFPLLGEGASILSISGTVLADTTQASGQEYFKIEAIPQAA